MLKTLTSAMTRLRTREDGESLGQTLLARTGHETEIEDQPHGEDREPAHLFRCSSCGTIYIDTDGHPCSTCNSAVERVPATLAEAENR